jgi:hypothetical protein
MSELLGESTLTILIAIVAAVFPWVALIYQHFSNKPKIKGKILQVMRGTFPNPERPSESLTTFTIFLYLTNARKNALHIRDYLLEIEAENKFEKMKIVRGLKQISILGMDAEKCNSLILRKD